MNFLRRLMYGRYGTDQLSIFMFVIYLILFVLQFVFRSNPNVYWALNVAGYIFIIIIFLRMLSRNIYKRQAENRAFLKIVNPVKNYFKYLKLKITERKGVKKLFRCPKCHQTIRVPKNKGKIAITCPKCRFEFIKSTGKRR